MAVIKLMDSGMTRSATNLVPMQQSEEERGVTAQWQALNSPQNPMVETVAQSQISEPHKR